MSLFFLIGPLILGILAVLFIRWISNDFDEGGFDE